MKNSAGEAGGNNAKLQRIRMRAISIAAGAAAMSFAMTTAHASDGCKFLLCIAGPWTVIPECRPTVLKVLRDTALGKPLPVCEMSGEGNQATNELTTAQTCPEMYRQYNDDSGAYIGCAYSYKIDVRIDGYDLWETVFWDVWGTSTWYSQGARDQLGAGNLDPKYDRDLAAWDAAHQPPDDGGGAPGG